MRNLISYKEMRHSLTNRMKRCWPNHRDDHKKVLALAKQKKLTVDEWRTLMKVYAPKGHKPQWLNELAVLLAGLPQWSDNKEEMAMRFSLVYSGLMKQEYGVGSDVLPEKMEGVGTVWPSRVGKAYKLAVLRLHDATSIAFNYVQETDMLVSELLQTEKRHVGKKDVDFSEKGCKI